MPNTQILHVSDFHANDASFEWLVSAARNVDLVALTGDLLDLNEHRPMGDQLERVLTLVLRVNTRIAICSGNHDSVAGAGPRLHQAAWLRELSSSRVWIDLDCIDFAKFHIRCIPWQGALPMPRGSEIWLHHAPPSGFPSAFARGGVDFGDWALGEACRLGDGPRVVLGGHVHDPVKHWAMAGKTWSLNPGFAAGANTPSHYTLHLERGVAHNVNGATGETDLFRLW